MYPKSAIIRELDRIIYHQKMHGLVFFLSSWLLLFTFALPHRLTAQIQGKHLFILSGQSNMARLDPSETFIPTLAKSFDPDQFIVVKDAHGGQPIRRWYKKWKPKRGKMPDDNGDLYQILMDSVAVAIRDQRVGSVTFVWMQGERDAREAFGDEYYRSLKGLLKQLRQDLRIKKINLVIGRLSDYDLTNSRYQHWTKVRQAQEKLANKTSNHTWVNTDDLNDGLNHLGNALKNDLHYSVEGYRTFGTRLATAAIKLIRGK